MGARVVNPFRSRVLPTLIAVFLTLAFMPTAQAHAAEEVADNADAQTANAPAMVASTDDSQDNATTLSEDVLALADWGTCKVTYNSTTGALTISGGVGASGTAPADYPWHEYCGTITSVTFTGNVSMPEGSSLTSMFGRGYYTDTGYYSNLTTINGLDKLDTTGVTDMVAMFYGCSSLTSLDLSSLNTKAATEMSGMFSRCVSLQEVTLGANFSFTGDGTTNTALPTPSSDYIVGATGNWVAESDGAVYTSEEIAALGDPADTYKAQIDLSVDDWGTCPVTFDADTGVLTIGAGEGASGANAESYPWNSLRSGIKQVVFSGQVTMPEASSLRYMLSSCSALTSVDLSKLDTTNVTDMRYLFSGCTSLTSVDLSKLDTTNVADMDHLFFRCASLTTADLSSLDTTNVTDMSYLFSGCESLESVDLNLSESTPALTNMAGMFAGCASLTSLDLSALNTALATNMSGLFGDCSSLTSLDLSALNTASVTNMSGMVEGCSSLTSICMPSSTSKVKTFSGMFYGCTSLTSIDLSSVTTTAATDMTLMFSNCSALTSLNLSSFDTSSVQRMASMFSGCNSLESLDLSTFNTSSAKRMGNLFSGCSALTSVTLGDEFSFNGSTASRIAKTAFPTPSDAGLTGKWLSSADGLAYAPDAIPNNVAATYTPEQKTYTLTLEATEGEWGNLVSGYKTSNTVTYTIKNTGNMPVTDLAIALSGTDSAKFTIDKTNTAEALEPGASTTFKVSFGTGCAAATYTAQLKVSAAENTTGTTVDISQKVEDVKITVDADGTTGTAGASSTTPNTGDNMAPAIALLLCLLTGILALIASARSRAGLTGDGDNVR